MQIDRYSWLKALWRVLLASTMVVMVVSVFLGVISRYVFGAPLFWTEEVSRYALTWMTFLGIVELFRLGVRGHITVDVVLNLLPARWRRITEAIGLGSAGLMLIAMIAGGYFLANPRRPAVSAALGIPMWLVYVVIPVSGVLSLWFVLRHVVGLYSPQKGQDR